MNNHLHQDTYYDHTHSRSPGAHRYQPQTLHRQPSRHFDAYGQMPNNVYTPEEHNMRYEASRFDRMNTAGPSTGYNTYDGASLQPWPTNPFHGGQPLPSFGASGRMRPNPRQRSGIPPVSVFHVLCIMLNSVGVRGLISDSRPGLISNKVPQPTLLVESAHLRSVDSKAT